MRIALVGSFPPPCGGISVYIKRLSDYLSQAGIHHTVYAYGGDENIKGYAEYPDKNIVHIKNTYTWLLKYFFSPQERLVHLNKTTPIHFFVFGLLAKFKRIKFIINRHGEHLYGGAASETDKSMLNRVKIACLNFGFRNADHIIMVNEKMRPALGNLGIPDDRISCIPPFIPPTGILADNRLPTKLIDFTRKFKYILSSFGSITLFNGQDLYGIDMLVQLMEALKRDDTGLIIYLRKSKLSRAEQEHYQKLIQQINSRDLNLRNRIFLYEASNEEFWPVLTKSNIFIRPTNTDGDAVSVRESLFFKVKTICSDATIRPRGVILFKSRNVSDLVEKTMNTLINIKKNNDISESNNIDWFTNAKKIIALYNANL